MTHSGEVTSAFVSKVVPIALTAIFVLAGCKSNAGPETTSTETHFLTYCDGKCGPGLDCLCGVCTRACTGGHECSAVSADAECVTVPQGPNSESGSGSCQQGATCDLGCVTSADCEVLGGDYACESGSCRKGSRLCPLSALRPGDEVIELVVGGVTRSYTRHVPKQYDGSAPVPLVLDFHPMTLGLDWERQNSGFLELSDQEGFIVAWPLGTEDTWNLGPCCTTSKTTDDFSFARAVVKQVSNDACVDPKRVYAVGFSMGAGLAYYLACDQAEVFAAVAISGMDLLVDAERTCSPSRPVSEIAFRGTADTTVPYDGGNISLLGLPDLTMKVLGAVGTFEKWAKLNDCKGTPSKADSGGCSTYSDCAGGTEATLCTLAGQGQVFGDAQRAWDFLKRHPMP